MQVLNSIAKSQPEPGSESRTEMDDVAVIRITPDPFEQKTAASGLSPDLDLPPELTYGCVEWFDYKSHPLKTGKH